MAVAMACVESAAEHYSFLNRSRGNALVCFVVVKVVKFTYAIAWVLKRDKIRAGRRTTFGTGVAVPFVSFASRSWASAVLSHGHLEHPTRLPRL